MAHNLSPINGKLNTNFAWLPFGFTFYKKNAGHHVGVTNDSKLESIKLEWYGLQTKFHKILPIC
jgi:hypothetical protein